MTSYDFHHEKSAVQKMERKKIFAFWEMFANDRHRPTSFLFSSPGGKEISRTKNENFSHLQSFYEIGNLQSTIDKKDRQYSENAGGYCNFCVLLLV